MFPDFATRMWEAMGFAPLVISGPKLDAARRRISRSVHRPRTAESQVRSVSANPRPRNLGV